MADSKDVLSVDKRDGMLAQKMDMHLAATKADLRADVTVLQMVG